MSNFKKTHLAVLRFLSMDGQQYNRCSTEIRMRLKIRWDAPGRRLDTSVSNTEIIWDLNNAPVLATHEEPIGLLVQYLASKFCELLLEKIFEICALLGF
jgi:hypothetical protein